MVPPRTYACFCEIDQVAGAALDDCRTSTTPTSNGWCYVAASEGPAQAANLAKCPPSAQQEIRFVGQGAAMPGATLFISCP